MPTESASQAAHMPKRRERAVRIEVPNSPNDAHRGSSTVRFSRRPTEQQSQAGSGHGAGSRLPGLNLIAAVGNRAGIGRPEGPSVLAYPAALRGRQDSLASLPPREGPPRRITQALAQEELAGLSGRSGPGGSGTGGSGATGGSGSSGFNRSSHGSGFQVWGG